ncbi:MAG: small multi-drug export protein [Planctomycetes bacterium]|nr:small multi-drug export protein [Planctomycetota bacterium]
MASERDPEASSRTEGLAEERGRPAAVILPLALSVSIVTLFLFFEGPDAAVELVLSALATATVLGKFAVLRGLESSGLLDSPYKMALLIIYLDVLIATIAIFNIRLLHKIPRFGAKIAALQSGGERILERNPWMRKATFLGIIAFVMFPLSGTGAIGGALFGRLLGLSRARTMAGISIGAVLGAFMMAALADLFRDQMKSLSHSGVLLWAGLAFVGGVLYWLWRRAKAMTGDQDQEPPARP